MGTGFNGGCLPGVAGLKQLLRAPARMGGLGEVDPASNIDRVSEQMPVDVRPAGLKEGKKNGAYQLFCSWRSFLQIPGPLAYTLKSVTTNRCLCAGSLSE